MNLATKLHYKGARVFLTIIDDLKAKGTNHATNVSLRCHNLSYLLNFDRHILISLGMPQVIISDSSAGGLTSIVHFDNFRSLLPATTKVKCLSYAGYFINV